jgi:alkaline phosphatase D
MQPPMPGEKRLGAVVYEIDRGAIEAKIIEVPGLSPHWIDAVVEEVYPRLPDC